MWRSKQFALLRAHWFMILIQRLPIAGPSPVSSHSVLSLWLLRGSPTTQVDDPQTRPHYARNQSSASALLQLERSRTLITTRALGIWTAGCLERVVRRLGWSCGVSSLVTLPWPVPTTRTMHDSGVRLGGSPERRECFVLFAFYSRMSCPMRLWCISTGI